jgi:hypothetical protein
MHTLMLRCTDASLFVGARIVQVAADSYAELLTGVVASVLGCGAAEAAAATPPPLRLLAADGSVVDEAGYGSLKLRARLTVERVGGGAKRKRSSDDDEAKAETPPAAPAVAAPSRVACSDGQYSLMLRCTDANLFVGSRLMQIAASSYDQLLAGVQQSILGFSTRPLRLLDAEGSVVDEAGFASLPARGRYTVELGGEMSASARAACELLGSCYVCGQAGHKRRDCPAGLAAAASQSSTSAAAAPPASTSASASASTVRAAASPNASDTKRPRGPQRGAEKGRCYLCGELGHKKRQCPGTAEAPQSSVAAAAAAPERGPAAGGLGRGRGLTLPSWQTHPSTTTATAASTRQDEEKSDDDESHEGMFDDAAESKPDESSGGSSFLQQRRFNPKNVNMVPLGKRGDAATEAAKTEAICAAAAAVAAAAAKAKAKADVEAMARADGAAKGPPTYSLMLRSTDATLFAGARIVQVAAASHAELLAGVRAKLLPGGGSSGTDSSNSDSSAGAEGTLGTALDAAAAAAAAAGARDREEGGAAASSALRLLAADGSVVDEAAFGALQLRGRYTVERAVETAGQVE